MGGSQDGKGNASGFEVESFHRKPGDVIRSADWNALVDEIGKLGRNKPDAEGGQTVKGPLTVSGTLSVLEGTSAGGSLEPECGLVVRKDASEQLGAEMALVNKGGGPGASVAIDFGVDNSTYTGELGNAQIKVTNLIGDPDNASKMTFSTWDGASFGERMTIMPEGKVGVGTSNPKAALDVRGDIHCSGRLYDQSALAYTAYHSTSRGSGAIFEIMSLARFPNQPGNLWKDENNSNLLDTGITTAFPSTERDYTLHFNLTVPILVTGEFEHVRVRFILYLDEMHVTDWDESFYQIQASNPSPYPRHFNLSHIHTISLSNSKERGRDNVVSVKIYIENRGDPFKISLKIPGGESSHHLLVTEIKRPPADLNGE